MSANAVNAWDKQPNEPALWYGRFDAYRSLGTSRSVEAAFAACRKVEGLTATRPGAAWYDAAQRYQWQQRAEAWDEQERQRLRSAEEARRFDAREERISVTRRLLNAALRVIEIAELPNLEMSEAREMLPTIRMILRDALVIQRQEFGAPTTDESGKPALPAFTADDLIAAQRELDIRSGGGAVVSGNAEVGRDMTGRDSTIINVYPKQ